MIDRTTAPAPEAPRPYQFPHITRTTLANGLRLLIAENHNAPIVALRGLIRSGADQDDSHNAGLAAITSDLLDEGAGERDAIRLAEDIGTLGGALATGADWDASYVSVDALSRNAQPALEILADIAARATLPADGLERVRSEHLNELLQQRDEPAVIASKRFSNLIFGSGAYGNSVSGNPETVAKISSDAVRAFHRAHYLPNNTSIIVSGDVDRSAVAEWVARSLESWQPGAEPPRATVAPRSIPSSRIFLIDRPQAVQSEIRVGHMGIARSSSDYFAVAVMNSILGGMFNSRINLNLREKHGYTYGARSQFATRRHPGPFVVAAPVRNEVTREAVTEILNELRRIRTGDLEDRELNDTRSYLMGVFPATVQTASDIASRLTDMEIYGLPEDYFDRYRENIGAVSGDDVVRAAQKYIDPDRLWIVVVGNAAQIREPLSSLGMPVTEMDIDGNVLKGGE